MRRKQWSVLVCGVGVAAMLAGSVAVSARPEAEELLGDINGDGRVNSADCRLLWRYLDGNYTLTKSQLSRADVTGNGLINPLDAKRLWTMTLPSADATASTTEDAVGTEAPSEHVPEPTEADQPETFDTTAEDEYIFSTTATTTTTAATTTTTTTAATTTTTTTATTADTTASSASTASTATTTATTTTVPTQTQPVTGPTAQTPPIPARITAAPAHPVMKPSPVSEWDYVKLVKVRAWRSNGGEQLFDCTGFDYTTAEGQAAGKEQLQLAVAAVVKCELGAARNAVNSTEAWKAQAVSSYTHVLRWHLEGNTGFFSVKISTPLDVENDPNDKRIYEAVGEVLGVKMMIPSATGPLSRLCYSFYSAVAAGSSSSCHKVYTANLPYAQAVSSPENAALVSYYDGNSTRFTRSYTYSFAEILAETERYMGKTIYYDTREDAFSLYATEWDGGYMAYSNLYYLDSRGQKVYVKGTAMRSILESSTHAILVTAQDGDTLTVQLTGRGHGVGLSQIGAVIFANEYNWTYDQIMAHYYSVTPDSVYQICLPNW